MVEQLIFLTMLALIAVALLPSAAASRRLLRHFDAGPANDEPDLAQLRNLKERRRLDGKSGTGKAGKGSKSKSKGKGSKSKGGSSGGFCGCQSCTANVLERKAGRFTCEERISHLMNDHTGVFSTTTKACRRVAGLEFPRECGACDPDTCDGKVAITDEDEEVEINQTEPEDEPEILTLQDPTLPPTSFPTSSYCGCTECTAETWNAFAPLGTVHTCSSRIEYMMTTGGLSELDACRFIAGEEEGEFPLECAPCDPGRCNGEFDVPSPSPTVGVITPAPTLPPHTPALQAETPLYCFPDYEERVRWMDVWGGYNVEVKKSPSNEVCGPGDNRFSDDTVSLVNDELTLRYEKVNEEDGWVGSEVRILLPQEMMPYSYGHFKFSVKSVEVKDKVTGEISAKHLPLSIVLGMFTWDTTDKYDVNEYWSHEVDIELSRWGNEGIEDGQFVIQVRREM